MRWSGAAVQPPESGQEARGRGRVRWHFLTVSCIDDWRLGRSGLPETTHSSLNRFLQVLRCQSFLAEFQSIIQHGRSPCAVEPIVRTVGRTSEEPRPISCDCILLQYLIAERYHRSLKFNQLFQVSEQNGINIPSPPLRAGSHNKLPAVFLRHYPPCAS